MSSVKISARTEATSIEGTDVVGIYRPGTPNLDRRVTVANLLAGGVQPVSDPITLNGTTDATTARLIYGINVIRTSTASNFCARLPETPQKGKGVIIVNLGDVHIRIFPSVTGGAINGVVDGYAEIPNNGAPHTIYCYENPEPGDWSFTPLNTDIVIPDFDIAHTNGVETVRCGTVTPQSSSIGSGTDGSGHMTLTPASTHWRSENSVASAVKLKVYTNIVAADVDSDLAADCISVWRSSAYKTGASGATSAQRETILFGTTGAQTGGFYPGVTAGTVSGGVLNSPPEIGDVGTFYGEVVAEVGLGNQIGTGGAFSNYYYIFGIEIPESAASKTYKFRIVLEYI